jgi:hypothetical protein
MKHVKTFEQYDSELTNEGKVTRGLLKGAVILGGIIAGCRKLVTRNGARWKDIFKTVKMGNKMIDLVVFMNDQKSWVKNDNLSDDDLKVIAKNYGIKKENPNLTDVIKGAYKKEIGRELASDVNDMYVVFNDTDAMKKINNPTPENISEINKMKEWIGDLKELVE